MIAYTASEEEVADRNEFLTPICPRIWRKTRTEMLKKRTNVPGCNIM